MKQLKFMQVLAFALSIFSTAFVLTLSFSANAEEDHVCAAVGVQAEKVMNQRQANDDMMKVLGLHSGEKLKQMVLDAYDFPRINTAEQLSVAVRAYGTRAAADEMRRYNELNDKQSSIVQQFKNQQIKECLRNRMRSET